MQPIPTRADDIATIRAAGDPDRVDEPRYHALLRRLARAEERIAELEDQVLLMQLEREGVTVEEVRHERDDR